MLADHRPRACDHKRTERRHIYRPAPVPARAAGVHDLDAHLQALSVGTHGAHKADHLLHRLTFGAKPGHESPYLGRGSRPFEDIVEGGRGLIRRQVLAAQDLAQDPGPAAYVLERDRHGTLSPTRGDDRAHLWR